LNKKHTVALLPLTGTVLLTAILYAIFSGADGFVHNINPVITQFTIFKINIIFRYYGLVYFIGFLTIYVTLARKRALGELQFGTDQVEIFLFFSFLAMIGGARLFEVLFYDIGYYLSNPIEILKIWKGGLSFHGALAGVGISAWLYTRRKKTHFLELTDILTLPAALLLSLGRCANFINGEIYGTMTSLPWGVKFQGAEGFRHPVQIYEALKNLYIFSLLYYFRFRKPPRGALTFTFLLLYGLFRFIIEFLKNYTQYNYKTLETPLLNIAQLLCLIMIASGIIGLIRIYKQQKQPQSPSTS